MLKLSHRCHQSGVSLHEYAILIGLIGLLSILGLKSLGGSTNALLENSGNTLVNNSPLTLLTAKKSASSGQGPATPLKGSGYYGVVTDPKTGMPTLQLMNSVQASDSNVSSLDGTRMNTLGTIMLANKLEQMAQKETDPEIKNYYAQMAKLSFYLGAAEGELDDVPGLGLNPPQYHYTNASALQDILHINRQLQTMLHAAPAGLNATDLNQVLTLGTNVYNIANNYENNLQQFILDDGTVVDFLGSTNTSGDGQPGSIFNKTDLSTELAEDYPIQSYATLISYEQLKASAHNVLSDHQVDSLPVETTLKAADTIDNTATSKSKP